MRYETQSWLLALITPFAVSALLFFCLYVGNKMTEKDTNYQNNSDYSKSQVDVYNMRMLINCLQELKEIKGGDTHVK